MLNFPSDFRYISSQFLSEWYFAIVVEGGRPKSKVVIAERGCWIFA